MMYFIGQRVIVGGDTIATIIEAPKRALQRNDDSRQWVRLPNGWEQWRAIENVKPLPNGQL